MRPRLAGLLATLHLAASLLWPAPAGASPPAPDTHVLPQALAPGSGPPADPQTYVVQPGDTLMAISRRFGVELAALVEANSIANPNLIYVGQRLLIPSPPAAAPAPTPTSAPPGGVHLVQRGETLYRIALRYGSTVSALVAANGLSDPNLIYVGQRLIVPQPAAVDPFLRLSMAWPAQGSTVIIQLAGAREASGRLGEQVLRFAPLGDDLVALASFAAWEAPGARQLDLSYTLSSGERRTASQWLNLQAASFPLERWAAGSGRLSIPPEVIAAERQRLQAIFAQFQPQRLWSGAFRLPLEQYRLTSDFGTRRAFGSAPPSWWHEGLDMAAPTGTPVRAPAAGVVVLAESLAVRGGAVILDHGWGVFSGYWHLSEISVSPGMAVRPGELLGRVGSTGLSTGPHLHWEIRVNGLPVQPRQWLEGILP